jgi:hypothetical protein
MEASHSAVAEKRPPTAKPALASAASKDTFIKAKLKSIYVIVFYFFLGRTFY